MGCAVGKVGAPVVGSRVGFGVGEEVPGELVGDRLVGWGVGFAVVGSRYQVE